MRAAAGGAALAMTGCAPSRLVARLAGRAQRCVDAGVPAAGGVHVVRGSFAAARVKGPVQFVLVIPDAARPPDAVVYVLPGRGSDAASALALGLDGFLADYLRRGGVRFALAIVDAGESYFHPRAHGEDRLAMVTGELPRIVRHELGGAPVREAIMGYAMGGYGALLAAERSPGRYRAVAVAGPAIFPSYEDERRSVGDAFDSARDFAAHDVVRSAGALRDARVFVAIGRRDPFVPGARLLAAAAPAALLVEQPGCHDDGFWRTATPAMLRFLGAAFSRRGHRPDR